MSDYNIINIREVIYSTGNLAKAKELFESYGGWNIVGSYSTDKRVLTEWNLPPQSTAEEVLLQSNHYPSGQLRLMQFHQVEQEVIRSSQQPWDVGGIMDINLRVHKIKENFDALRERGWHGLSDPLFQTIGPFKLYDVLMRGMDDIIIAFTHRVEPPMELKAQINFPTHVYKSTLTVNNLSVSKNFFINQLGFKVLTEYEFVKDKPQENMFGFPHNLADKVKCKAVIISAHGGNDVDFQIVEFDGVDGKDFSSKAKPPNKGFLMFRVEVKGLENYYNTIKKSGVKINTERSYKTIKPYGEVNSFSVLSPNGSWFEFFETV